MHLWVSLSPKIAICELVRRLKKGGSSYEVRKRLGKELRNKLWSPSYCVVSCGGASLEVVRSYVENQGRV